MPLCGNEKWFYRGVREGWKDRRDPGQRPRLNITDIYEPRRARRGTKKRTDCFRRGLTMINTGKEWIKNGLLKDIFFATEGTERHRGK